MARADLGLTVERWHRRILAAETPDDRFLAAVDVLKALAALLGRAGNAEAAGEIREDAAAALTDVFLERCARLGVAPAAVADRSTPQ